MPSLSLREFCKERKWYGKGNLGKEGRTYLPLFLGCFFKKNMVKRQYERRSEFYS